jgi:hypothetical protein
MPMEPRALAELQRERGQLARQYLETMIASPAYRGADDAQRAQMLESAISRARFIASTRAKQRFLTGK